MTAHPYDHELEKIVLGEILYDNTSMPRVVGVLTEDCFHDHANRLIFKAMTTLFASGTPIDMLTVVQQLKRDDNMLLAGGVLYVSGMTDRVGTTTNLEYHVAILSDYRMKRNGMDICSQYTELFSGDTDPKEIYSMLSSDILRLGLALPSRVVVFSKLVVGVGDKIKEVIDDPKTLVGVPTGMRAVDNLSRGYKPGDLIIIAGRPGMGKTAWMLSMALNQARMNIPVHVFSLEMTAEQLTKRAIAQSSQMSYYRIDSGKMTKTDVDKAVADLSVLNITIDDTAGISLSDMRAKVMNSVMTHGTKVVAIDYLQLMSGDRVRGNREVEIGDISRGLKRLAKDTGVVVVVLAQLSRKVEERADKRPILADLRESGSLEQDADMVMFLFRPSYYKIKTESDGMPIPDDLGIGIMAKNRNGKTGDIPLRFIEETMTYSDFDIEQDLTETTPF